jgi:Arc/MetJ-type ribon-helix-helix transcriptional regulator
MMSAGDRSMTQLQITLPEEAGRFIDDLVASGRFQSPSDFIAQLIEQERVKAAKTSLTERIREGMESGPGEEITDQYWQQFDHKLQAELKRGRSA